MKTATNEKAMLLYPGVSLGRKAGKSAGCPDRSSDKKSEDCV